LTNEEGMFQIEIPVDLRQFAVKVTADDYIDSYIFHAGAPSGQPLMLLP